MCHEVWQRYFKNNKGAIFFASVYVQGGQKTGLFWDQITLQNFVENEARNLHVSAIKYSFFCKDDL